MATGMEATTEATSTEPTTTTTEPTITTGASCPKDAEFIQTPGECFFMESVNQKTWNDAEAFCQALGNNVHLATLDTKQVMVMGFFSK